MVQNRNLAYDFNKQSSIPILEPEVKPEFKVLKSKKLQTGPNSKVSLILTMVAIFAMLIVISYRYNIISEKNLELQRQNIKLENASSILATTEIDLKQGNDIEYIENYAKQQLGMQKPEKNQIIYINADYKSEVTSASEDNIFTKIITSIKNIVK